MQRLTLLILAVLFLFGVSLRAQEEEKIKQTIIQETSAYADGDFEKWQEQWLHSDHAVFSYANPNMHLYLVSWDEIRSTFKESFDARERQVRDAKIIRNNWQIKRKGKMAFVSFDQYDLLEGQQQQAHSEETRVLQKTRDGWKILSVQVGGVLEYDRSGQMLHHVVLADFKPGTSPSEVRKMADTMAGLVDKIDGMESFAMFQNPNKDGNAQYSFVMTFASVDAQQAFNQHEEHMALGELWGQIGQQITVIDEWKPRQAN